jgi:hypothetical protein
MTPSPQQKLLLTAFMASVLCLCQGFAPSSFLTNSRHSTSDSLLKYSRLQNELQMSSRGAEEVPDNRQRRSSSRSTNPTRDQNNSRDPDKDVSSPSYSSNSNNSNNNDDNALWNDVSNQLKTLPGGSQFKMPPLQVDDPNLLLYDIFLLLNLVVSISFWVVHRMQLEFISLAFNEGCLLSILWIVSGLYHGAFLESAKDGHQQPNISSSINTQQQQEEQDTTQKDNNSWWTGQSSSRQGGPPAAGLLALNTYINTISLRLLCAFAVAVVQHRQVGMDPMEQFITYEVGFGLVLMSVWRSVHSAFTPRV